LLSSVHKVRPGHVIFIQNGRTVSTNKYWDIAAGVQPTVKRDDREAISEIKGLLQQAVNRQMVSDVPVGAFLSGAFKCPAVLPASDDSRSTSGTTRKIAAASSKATRNEITGDEKKSQRSSGIQHSSHFAEEDLGLSNLFRATLHISAILHKLS